MKLNCLLSGAFLVMASLPTAGPAAASVAPAECSDPIAGVWHGRYHMPDYGDWHDFVLTIRRGDGGVLVGKIMVEFWDGDATQADPPKVCRVHGHYTGTMTARGSFAPDGHAVTFDGQDFAIDKILCGRKRGDISYSPDRFVGKLENGTLTLQNRDGWRDPTSNVRFSRTSCKARG